MYDKVMESVEFINKQINIKPKIAVILGSGLGNLTNFIDNATEINYKSIPHFPQSTVIGHKGQLVAGNIGEKEIFVMDGRFHYYEGYSMREVTYPIYVFKKLGIEKIIISNAAGGINETFSNGTLMIIRDFINLFGTNPLIGTNDERFGSRFPDMTNPFSEKLIVLAKKIAVDFGIKYSEGTYLGTTGPSFETVAEIKMMKTFGADAVGMSTVPEVIISNYLGLEVLGISCITNMATGLSKVSHSHQNVIKEAKKIEHDFCLWISEIIKNI
ncbi:MAG: purine-nucleoside phosphorylase [Fusobacteriaceae bacterium]|jgi:purine-nucleoside phosphorylase|nr:purine-nucleoside phosphorylase [Fusobacteriaceae bacterium]